MSSHLPHRVQVPSPWHIKGCGCAQGSGPPSAGSVVPPTGPAPETAHATAAGPPMLSSASDGAAEQKPRKRSAAPSEIALSATRSEVSPAVVPVTETSTSQSPSQPQIQASVADRSRDARRSSAAPADWAHPKRGWHTERDGPSAASRTWSGANPRRSIRSGRRACHDHSGTAGNTALLQHDEPRLQQALDQAGVLSDWSNGQFSGGRTGAGRCGTASRSDSMTAGSDDSGQGQSGGAWRQNGDASRQSGQGSGSDNDRRDARWFRAGLDITA